MDLVMWVLMVYLIYVVVGTILLIYDDHLQCDVTIGDLGLNFIFVILLLPPISLIIDSLESIFSKMKSLITFSWSTVIIKRKVTEDDMMKELRS